MRDSQTSLASEGAALSLDFVHGGVKLKRVRALLDDATEIVIVAGYASASGFKKIQASLKKCLDGGGEVLLLLGIDRAGVAGPELIRSLGKLLNSYEKLRVRFVIESGRSFLHAKIYAARKKGGAAQLIVGSFNLTSKGFGQNKEFAVDVSGQAKEIFGGLRDFINGIEPLVLDAENWEECAEKLEPIVPELEPEEEEAREKSAAARREELAQRFKRLADILPKETEEILRKGGDADLDELLSAGSFYSIKFDLKKTTVPAGLKFLFKNNILSKEKVTDTGTAKYREPPGSASWPLLPAHLHKRYTDCGKGLKRALSDVGFETPYGYWVPDCFLHRLQGRVQTVAAGLPPVSEAEELIEQQIEIHKKEAQRSAEFIVARATRDGINPPTAWKKVKSQSFTLVSTKYLEQKGDERSWNPDGELYGEALKAIEAHVARTIGELNPQKALQKIRRLRPELHPVPVVVDGAVTNELLESMVWAVMEAMGSKKRRPVVDSLYQIVKYEEDWIVIAKDASTDGRAIEEPDSPVVMEKKLEDLGLLSEALLNGEDLETHQATFFAIFGGPPFWASLFGEGIDGDEDEDWEGAEDDDE